MRTASLATLLILAFGAMTAAILQMRAAAEDDALPVVTAPMEYHPGPGWLHKKG
jgi:hypothetical protein